MFLGILRNTQSQFQSSNLNSTAVPLNDAGRPLVVIAVAAALVLRAMRGPAYSTDRELSHEFEQTGSPSTPSFIDPALAQIAGPAYSPAYYTNGGLGHVHEPMLVRNIRLLVLRRDTCAAEVDRNASRRAAILHSLNPISNSFLIYFS